VSCRKILSVINIKGLFLLDRNVLPFSPGQASEAAAMKSELSAVVSGLERYLGEVGEKADRQRDQYDHLLRERGELAQRLADLEEERERARRDADRELEALREVSVGFAHCCNFCVPSPEF
jgi:hypothetical protein